MREMVINYVPGDICRVAVVENNRLEEFQAERMSSAGHVGNIYIGKVVNVEPAIQAAFIDFGLEHNGFLHLSDLHPRYFPGENDETTERVGKKTPRRDRPPIQECLKRGQEIAVQVLKEGVGTKGPTVTSYLSIPGRFLVMMPQMDRVGVSRKVEDDDLRKRMRQILDELELPEGFGFILRTAGLEQTKRELKRDLAYLARLWKDMERLWNAGGKKPRLLYSESDLLVRALRDMLTSEIDRIVVDNETALRRAARFLKIVAPRTGAELVHYARKAPIFHTMGIEEQIQMIHAREVPLPSGGRLVIDETEALVAIDVNSGRMRNTRDAETTALRTNLEAADEICRQLRLRDLGGLVIHDLIDMRPLKHRREVEARFKENLKRDRSRSTVLPISAFGIMEMTRQRMRGSHESVHFAPCPTCRARGLLQRPDSVVMDALGDLAALLEHERVAKAEMVVSPRIAGELLSARRRSLSRVERVCGKQVEVRVSDAVPTDRVIFHAYDDRGADVDVSKLKSTKAAGTDFVPWEQTAVADEDWASEGEVLIEEPDDIDEVEDANAMPLLDDISTDHDGEEADKPTKKRRRRRRGGRGRGGSAEEKTETSPQPAADAETDETDAVEGGNEEAPTSKSKRRRRRKKAGAATEAADADEAPATDDATAPTPEAGDDDATGEPTTKKKRRRRRSRRKSGTPADDAASDGANSDDAPEPASGGAEQPDDAPEDASDDATAKKKTKRRRRRGSGKGGAAAADAGEPAGPAPAPTPESNGAPKKPRTLYSSRRKLSASELANIPKE